MKKVEFSKRWRWPLSETSYEAYSPGDIVIVSDERADAASKAGVLKAPPEPAPESEPASRKPKA